MTRKGQILLLLSILIAVVVVALALQVIYAGWMFRRESRPLITQEGWNGLRELTQAAIAMKRGLDHSCVVQEDLTSIGDKDKESQLTTLDGFVAYYQLQTGRLPTTPLELISMPGIPVSAREEMRTLSANCVIFLRNNEGYLLNCDGLKEDSKVTKAINTVGAKIKRFYLIDGHEALFSPSLICSSNPVRK